MIVNKDHPITKLIIQHYHEENLHVGREETLSSLRSKYWISACCGIISSIITSSYYCKKERTVLPIYQIFEEFHLKIAVCYSHACAKEIYLQKRQNKHNKVR